MKNLYPNSIFDNNIKTCCQNNCTIKPQNSPHNFNVEKFYPHSLPQQKQASNTYQNQKTINQNKQNKFGFQIGNLPHNFNQNFSSNNFQFEHNPSFKNFSQQSNQKYDYNDYMQTNSYNNFSQSNQPWNEQNTYQNQNINPPNQNPQQRNMFGSLDPQQILSMITNKNSFAGILSNLKNTNPQLSMLLSLMQNSPKTKKQQKEKQPQEIIVDQENENKKESPYKKVTDFYKENP